MCLCTCIKFDDVWNKLKVNIQSSVGSMLGEHGMTPNDFAAKTKIHAIYDIAKAGHGYYAFITLVRVVHHLGYDMEISFKKR